MLSVNRSTDLPWHITVSHAALRNHRSNCVEYRKNHSLTWYKGCLLIGQFDFEVHFVQPCCECLVVQGRNLYIHLLYILKTVIFIINNYSDQTLVSPKLYACLITRWKHGNIYIFFLCVRLPEQIILPISTTTRKMLTSNKLVLQLSIFC